MSYLVSQVALKYFLLNQDQYSGVCGGGAGVGGEILNTLVCGRNSRKGCTPEKKMKKD